MGHRCQITFGTGSVVVAPYVEATLWRTAHKAAAIGIVINSMDGTARLAIEDGKELRTIHHLTAAVQKLLSVIYRLHFLFVGYIANISTFPVERTRPCLHE